MSRGRPRRTVPITALTAAALAVAVLSAVTGTDPVMAAGHRHRPVPRVASIGDAVGSGAAAAFRQQTLTWKPCIDRAADPGLPSGYYRQQCADLTAPLDWRHPDAAPTVTVAVSRLPATHRPAAGALFTNPGGPGAEGVNLPLLFLSDGRRALLRSQDVYGMDVRGTGQSTNVTCGGSPSSTLDPRDRDPANLALMVDGARFLARSCDTAGGALMDVVDTEQTVQDIELLRVLVGAPSVNWLGYSAGTWLGAHYAAAFPSRVGHMVLDSSTDVTGGWQQAFDLQPMGFERRFRSDFLPWVAKYHRYYRLGTTGPAVEAGYERIRAGLAPQRPVDSAVLLDQFMAGAMYSASMFPLAALVLKDYDTALAAAASGRPGAARRAYALAGRRGRALLRASPAGLGLAPGTGLSGPALARRPMSSDAADAAFLAVTCNDSPWSGTAADLEARSAELGASYPLIGYSTLVEPCVFWNRPALPLDVPTGVGSPPVLMVQSEHDPATPLEGARRTAAALAGARMLLVTHSGDHGQYASGNACVDAAVEAYLLHGTLPAAGATCRGLPLPAPDSYAYGASGTRVTRHGLPARGSNPLLALRVLDTRLPSR